MKTLEEIYLDILLEDNYSDDKWQKYDSYRGIDFYIRTDGHLKQRLDERYNLQNTNLAFVLNIVKKFIKEELKDSSSILTTKRLQDFSFTVYAELSKVYVSGRFKMNKNKWRCNIATVLPPDNPRHNGNDIFKSVKM